MFDLNRVLSEYDIELLRIIANRWDIDVNTRDVKEAAQRLADAMRDPKRVEDVWARLDDTQRQALQTVAGSGNGRMQSAMFKRLFGEIRLMGPDRREREKPHLTPSSPAEALYYRGLIANGLDKTDKGTVAYTFVPTDLARLLPTSRTSYDTSEPTPAAASVGAVDVQPENVRAADTVLIDDLTTFMVYCQINTVRIAEGTVAPDVIRDIKQHFIGTSTAARLALMVALSFDLGIAAEQDGMWRPLPTIRKYLELSRQEQVRLLAETWLKSQTYNELWYVPGLKVDISAGTQNDPLLARQTILSYLELVPADKWWSVDSLIAEVHEEEPDFQRPNGDYDSWYIRDAQSGQFLRGFETWDRVDGAQLRFILAGVMNGLGLMDTAQNGTLCRLTAYGRGFASINDWPQPRSDDGVPTLKDDGTLEIPRAASRYDRFQIARFTEWLKPGDPFVYKLSAAGLHQALRQDIQPPQIIAFLRRITDDQIPDSVRKILETWGAGGDIPLTMERMVVLRVPTPELMQTIQSTPELRRYLATPLGPTAVAVRADQYQQLADALQAQGLLVQVEV